MPNSHSQIHNDVLIIDYHRAIKGLSAEEILLVQTDRELDFLESQGRVLKITTGRVAWRQLDRNLQEVILAFSQR